MMPVTEMPANVANPLPAIYFSRNPPGGGGTGSKKPGSTKARKPATKKPGGKKTPKKGN
jgi:hypothetical protein